MCRACSASTICFEHMDWRNDALGIIFAHMKNDQTGERKRDPRHIYANPVIPEICPILSLGIYWLCTTFESSSIKLFAGSAQKDRFGEILSRVFANKEFQQFLKQCGINPEDLGSHSIRKGSATYASSGSTACPSTTAVHLRAGWALQGVADTYLRYQSAGDQYVGRTVAGLPVDQPEFAILPPFFIEEGPFLAEAIETCFPQMPEHLYGIAKFALASVVYHREFLKKTLPKTHQLFGTPLFVSPTMINELAPKIDCRLNKPSDHMRATGIPPHITSLCSFKVVIGQLKDMIPKIEQVAPTVVDGVAQELEARAIGAGTVTRDQVQKLFSDFSEQSGLNELVSIIRNGGVGNISPAQQPPPNSQTQAALHEPYVWGGRFRLVPEDFKLPKLPASKAWIQWCIGNAALKYPPLKRLKPEDVPVDVRKRLSDFRKLMGFIQTKTTERGLWKDDPTIQEANEMFLAVEEELIEATSLPGTKRHRPEQNIWSTTAKRLGQAKRQRNE